MIALAGAATLSAQAAKPPAPAAAKPPVPAQVKPPAAAPVKPVPDKPSPTLTKVTVVFQADDSAKPPAAPVSIYLQRKDGFAAAMKQSVGGDFGAEKSIDLEVFGASVKADLTKLRISFKPAAEARWRFTCTVFLEWSDKTKTPVAFENILLTERNPAFETVLGGS